MSDQTDEADILGLTPDEVEFCESVKDAVEHIRDGRIRDSANGALESDLASFTEAIKELGPICASL